VSRGCDSEENQRTPERRNRAGGTGVQPVMRRATALLLVLLALTLAAGCADEDDDPVVAGPGDASDDGGGDPAPPGPGGSTEITPEPGVGVDVHERPFDEAEVLADEGAVRIFYTGGVQDCYVLDRVEVDATDPSSLAVTVFEGSRPGADACIEIAVFYSTTVEVDGAIGADTQVVDATDGQVKSG
jgi:hypothetical protein